MKQVKHDKTSEAGITHIYNSIYGSLFCRLWITETHQWNSNDPTRGILIEREIYWEYRWGNIWFQPVTIYSMGIK